MSRTPLIAVLLALSASVAHGQTSPKWLRCSAPNECEVSGGLVGNIDRRAASACLAAGYSRYRIADYRETTFATIALVRFSHIAGGTRPCASHARPDLERQALQIAKRNGYDWPVTHQGRRESREQETPERWTFEPGENEWGGRLPGFDEILSPFTQGLGRNENLVGAAFLIRNCSVTVFVGDPSLDASLSADERRLWAEANGLDGPDRIAEIRVDGVTVQADGKNVVVPNAGMIGTSKRNFGVSVWSAEHEEAAAFMWSVTDRDRALITEHFPHCMP